MNYRIFFTAFRIKEYLFPEDYYDKKRNFSKSIGDNKKNAAK